MPEIDDTFDVEISRRISRWMFTARAAQEAEGE